MQVSIRKADHIPGRKWLCPLVVEQQYPTSL
jgi:hypothetical protein